MEELREILAMAHKIWEKSTLSQLVLDFTEYEALRGESPKMSRRHLVMATVSTFCPATPGLLHWNLVSLITCGEFFGFL
jgi:hypothetical protein